MDPLLEELTLNARPSPQHVIVDGWVLNFGDGLSRGGNAIFPLYPSSTDVDKKIAMCEELYGQRGHETVFRVSSVTSPHDLDARLDVRGYTRISQTSVQASIAQFAPSSVCSTPSRSPMPGFSNPVDAPSNRL